MIRTPRPLSAALSALLAVTSVHTAAATGTFLFSQTDQESLLRFYNADPDGWNPVDNYDWVDNGTIPNWYAAYLNAGVFSTPPVFRVTNGSQSSTTSLYLNRPTTGNHNFASLSTRPYDPHTGVPGAGIGGVFLGTAFTNNTGVPVTSISIGYTGEQWAVRSGPPGTFEVSYSTGAASMVDTSATWNTVSELAYTSPWGFFTGNSFVTNPRIETRQDYRDVIGPVTVQLDQPLQPGETVWVRWFSMNHPGTDQSIGIDEVRITANPIAHFNASLTVGTDPDPRGLGWDYTDQVIQVGQGAGANGSLTVAAGNTLSYYDLLLATGDATTQGSVTVSGEDARLVSSLDTGFGSVLSVGTDGTGEILIENGGYAEIRKVVLGENPGSVGTMTLTGAGTSLSTPHNEEFLPSDWSIYVGNLGTGTLNVTDGASIDNIGWLLTGNRARDEHFGSGVVEISSGGVVNTNLQAQFSMNPGNSSTVTVTGSGSELNIGTYLHLGAYGEAEMFVRDGGRLFVGTHANVSRYEGSRGHLEVSGAGTTMETIEELYVGRFDEGDMVISDGAEVTIGDFIYVGSGATGDGLLTITGTTTVMRSAHLRVGNNGWGVVRVTDGGLLTHSSVLSIGYGSTGIGGVEVSAGGRIQSAGAVYAGRGGSGYLEVTDGGHVFGGAQLLVASNLDSTGTARVSGADSSVFVSTGVFVGASTVREATGTGEVLVEAGGKVETIGAIVMRGPSKLHLDGGAVITYLDLDIGDPESTLEFMLRTPGFQGLSASEAFIVGTKLSVQLGFQPAVGDQFVLLDVTSPGLATGNFTFNGSTLGEGDTLLVIDGPYRQLFSISYLHNGNDIAITAIEGTPPAEGDYASWRIERFGNDTDPAGAPEAQPAGQLVANLLFHALGLDLVAHAASGVPATTAAGTISFTRRTPLATRLVVEAADSLTATNWDEIAVLEDGAWTGSAGVSEEAAEDGLVRTTVTDPAGTGSTRFVRIRAALP